LSSEEEFTLQKLIRKEIPSQTIGGFVIDLDAHAKELQAKLARSSTLS
jgi:hypothetical protein